MRTFWGVCSRDFPCQTEHKRSIKMICHPRCPRYPPPLPRVRGSPSERIGTPRRHPAGAGGSARTGWQVHPRCECIPNKHKTPSRVAGTTQSCPGRTPKSGRMSVGGTNPRGWIPDRDLPVRWLFWGRSEYRIKSSIMKLLPRAKHLSL